MNRMFRENIIKNIILAVVLVITFFEIQSFVYSSSFTSDPAIIGSILIVVSILAVTACFGNFAFTYEEVNNNRLLGHITTGILMLVIGVSLEMTALLPGLLIGNFYILNLSFLLLYVASVFYDFWDLKRR